MNKEREDGEDECGTFFFEIWRGHLKHLNGPRGAQDSAPYIFLPADPHRLHPHLFSFFFLRAFPFFQHLQSTFDTSSRVDFNVNSLLRLFTNGKLASLSLPICLFTMMNNVVAPIIQNRGDYTVLAKRTN